HQEIRSHRGEGLFHRGARALPDGHGGHHRPHPEDHPQGGEERAQLVPEQGPDRHPQRLQPVHATSSAGMELGSARTGVWRRSLAVWPSRTTICRPTKVAMSGSWVTRTMVMPLFPSSWNRSITSTLVLESRLPVGSSARISL